MTTTTVYPQARPEIHVPVSDKPVLLLDMDGPLANFDLAFYQFVKRMRYTLDIESLDDPNRQRFMTQNMPLASERQAARREVDTSRWFLHLPVVPEAIEGVRELEQHFDVWVCTKPLEANRHCRDDKAAWLRGFFPQLENKLIIAPTKSLVHGAILLDDAPKHDCLARASWSPVLFPDVFNIQPGCGWEHLPRWKWGDPIRDLVKHAEPPF